MTVIEHTARLRVCPVHGTLGYQGADKYVARCRSCGRECNVVEYVPAEQLHGAVEALDELVRLKDGPRDGAYRAVKDAAWDRARVVLRNYGGQ